MKTSLSLIVLLLIGCHTNQQQSPNPNPQNPNPAKSESHSLGGKCVYDQMPFAFKVLEIKPYTREELLQILPYMPENINYYHITVTDENTTSDEKHDLERLLDQSIGDEFLKIHDVHVGKILKGTKEYIVEGTCKPFIYHLPVPDKSK